mmetsp:Transcript_11488/g.20788  ORF Transcript_11488/g.20788 Transcript_11488/m.20788 type:complete len:206 (+) Transcript_11488:243-860(+)
MQKRKRYGCRRNSLHRGKCACAVPEIGRRQGNEQFGCFIQVARLPVPLHAEHLQLPWPSQTGHSLHPAEDSPFLTSLSPTVIKPVPLHQPHSFTPAPLQHTHSCGRGCILMSQASSSAFAARWTRSGSMRGANSRAKSFSSSLLLPKDDREWVEHTGRQACEMRLRSPGQAGNVACRRQAGLGNRRTGAAQSPWDIIPDRSYRRA